MADAVSPSAHFSSGEKEVIERKLEISCESKDTKKDIYDFYEISKCVGVINRGNFQKVRAPSPVSQLKQLFLKCFKSLFYRKYPKHS